MNNHFSGFAGQILSNSQNKHHEFKINITLEIRWHPADATLVNNVCHDILKVAVQVLVMLKFPFNEAVCCSSSGLLFGTGTSRTFKGNAISQRPSLETTVPLTCRGNKALLVTFHVCHQCWNH